MIICSVTNENTEKLTYPLRKELSNQTSKYLNKRADNYRQPIQLNLLSFDKFYGIIFFPSEYLKFILINYIGQDLNKIQICHF